MNHNDIIKIIHDKTPAYISLFILIKFKFTTNNFFHILSFFFRFVGVLILCANFSLKLSEVQNKSLSYYLRYFTSQRLLELFGITNIAYIVISAIILIMFCLRIISYILLVRRLKNKKFLSKCGIIVYRILNIFEHLVYLLYPFILEFLGQIILSFIFPDTFMFERDQSKVVNIVCAILNLVLIILYNINNYFFMKLINKPYTIQKSGIKYRYSSKKFWIIFLMQNVSLVQNIQIYFSKDKHVKYFSYIYLCLFSLIFIILFILSIHSYNYKNLPNSFISVMASFAFISIVIKCVCSLCGYSFATTYSIVSVNILKLLLSIYFCHLTNSVSDNYLFKNGINELFKINKNISNSGVYESYIYILEILKELKNEEKNQSTVKLLNHIFQHQIIVL